MLGNHDWWEDIAVQRRRSGPVAAEALERAGVPVYENDVMRLKKDGQAFWIAGLGDQWAFWPKRENYQRFRRRGTSTTKASTISTARLRKPLTMHR